MKPCTREPPDVAHGNLSDARWALGDTVGAAEALAPHGERWTTLANHLLVTGDYAGAEQMLHELRELRHRSDNQASVSRGLANLYRLRGRIREAELVLREIARDAARSRRWREAIASTLTSAETILRYRADTMRALSRVDSVLASAHLDSIPPLNRPYLELVEFFSEAGDPGRAADYLEQYETLVPEMTRRRSSFYRVSAASIAEADGRTAEHIRALHQAYE